MESLSIIPEPAFPSSPKEPSTDKADQPESGFGHGAQLAFVVTLAVRIAVTQGLLPFRTSETDCCRM
jgi:hypothetical protein